MSCTPRLSSEIPRINLSTLSQLVQSAPLFNMVSQTEMVRLVTRILEGADLSQITGRIVRERVRDELGERAGNNLHAFKKSIRDALKTVLSSKNTPSAQENYEDPHPDQAFAKGPKVGKKQIDQSGKRDALVKEDAGEKGKGHVSISEDPDKNRVEDALAANDAEKKGGGGAPADEDAIEKDEDNATAGEAAGEKSRDDTPAIPKISEDGKRRDGFEAETKNAIKGDDANAGTAPVGGDDTTQELKAQSHAGGALAKKELDRDVDNKEEDGKMHCSEQRISLKKGNKRRLKLLAEDEEDINSNDESSSQLNANGDAQVATKISRKAQNIDQSGVGVKHAKRKRSNSSGLKTENHLEKLRSVCKQLGCPIPPMRQRNKTVPEKCAAAIEHLYAKGVHVPDPTLLTRKEIQKHRARLEQEKELAGLDTRFVCFSLYVCQFLAQLSKISLDLNFGLLPT